MFVLYFFDYIMMTLINVYFVPQIAVIGLSSEVTYPRDDACVKSTLVPMTFESKFFFTRFIDNLEQQDSKYCNDCK